MGRRSAVRAWRPAPRTAALEWASWMTAVLQQYLKGYPDRQTMGQLTFDILEWNTECDLIEVTGKWSLKREKEPVEGYFTLWFKRIQGSWKIVKDHTS